METKNIIVCEYCGVLLEKVIIVREQYNSNKKRQEYQCPCCKNYITNLVDND